MQTLKLLVSVAAKNFVNTNSGISEFRQKSTTTQAHLSVTFVTTLTLQTTKDDAPCASQTNITCSTVVRLFRTSMCGLYVMIEAYDDVSGADVKNPHCRAVSTPTAETTAAATEEFTQLSEPFDGFKIDLQCVACFI